LEKEYIRKDGSRIPVLVGVVQLEQPQKSYVCFIIDATERRRALEALKKAYDELELRVNERTVELQQEITRRQKAEEALRNQSITDSLTGLYNRRGFMTLAEQHLQLARRNGRGFLLFMIDLDDLKPINDTLGHAEGDYALSQAGTLLKSTFRESDIVARLGGDEFAVVAIEEFEKDEAAMFARLQQKLDDYNRYSGRPYKLGLSMGSVHVNPQDAMTIAQLLARADAALYEKKKHKNKLNVL
jgi:diguanylate cyclase (GGDEF)-like protein